MILLNQLPCHLRFGKVRHSCMLLLYQIGDSILTLYTKMKGIVKIEELHFQSIPLRWCRAQVGQQGTRKSTQKTLLMEHLLLRAQRITPILAFISFCLGCLNVPLHLLLLGGAIFRQPCGLLPWLVFTFVEHVVIGVPLIVFFGLISLYLAAQLELYIIAGGLIGSVVLLFLLSLSSWCTVLGCYHQFGREEAYSYDALCQNAGGMVIDSTGSSRRSAHHTGEHSYIPPGHPSHNRNSGTGYRVHQGGYYPPHQSSRQLPPVPR
jgi:hypothetical protein